MPYLSAMAWMAAISASRHRGLKRWPNRPGQTDGNTEMCMT